MEPLASDEIFRLSFYPCGTSKLQDKSHYHLQIQSGQESDLQQLSAKSSYQVNPKLRHLGTVAVLPLMLSFHWDG